MNRPTIRIQFDGFDWTANEKECAAAVTNAIRTLARIYAQRDLAMGRLIDLPGYIATPGAPTAAVGKGRCGMCGAAEGTYHHPTCPFGAALQPSTTLGPPASPAVDSSPTLSPRPSEQKTVDRARGFRGSSSLPFDSDYD